MRVAVGALRMDLATGAFWQGLLHRAMHPVWLKVVVLLLLLAAATSWGPSRRWMARVVHRLGLRLCWRKAMHHVGLATKDSSVPGIRRVVEIPAGDRLEVALPPGSRASALEASAEAIATCLHVREVRIARDPANAGRACVTLVRRDPLAESPSLVWPLLAAEQVDLYQPVPVGIDEDGHPVALSLPWHNVLAGGEPGAGKSSGLNMLVAAAALDPGVRLTLLDGKLVELAVWRRIASASVEVSVAEAIGVLRVLQAEMNERYRYLLDSGRRKVTPGDGLPLHVVVCDELAHYLTFGDRKETTEFANLLRDLVSRGRAAGVVVLAATQKPSSDVIPTSLRDLFGFRWSFRCATPQASDTILGSGWASQGWSAAKIDAASRGVGLLLHEGGVPVRMRACYLSDDDLGVLAARAEALRSTVRGGAQ